MGFLQSRQQLSSEVTLMSPTHFPNQMDPMMLSQALVWLWIIPPGRNVDPKCQSLPKELGRADGKNMLNEESHVAVPILSALKQACE